MTALIRGFIVLALIVSVSARAQVDLQAFLRKDRIGNIKLSPGGAYYAATIPLADRTVLVIMRRSDKALTAKVQGGEHSDIGGFWWVSDERVVVSLAHKFGALDQPQVTGELHAVNADGSAGKKLVGHDVDRYLKGEPFRAAYLLDTLPTDARHVLIATETFDANPRTQIERLNLFTGRRNLIAHAPVRRASFVVDSEGQTRFARGTDNRNASQLFYRENDKAEWRLLNDEAQSQRVEKPLGFSADGGTAYLQVEYPQGPDAVLAMDVASGERREVLRDDLVDPFDIIYSPDQQVPVGALFMKDRLYSRFFDEQSPLAARYRMLERAFSGAAVVITSSTRDGQLNLVEVWGDRNPGDFYLFNAQTRKADHVFSRAEWLDPAKMASTRAIELDARDGLHLHGYLTAPSATPGQKLPLLVVPHGGPFGVFDAWGFDSEAQILAAAGYAVLQVNYRGSSNYGRAFQIAGASEWGGLMQGDLTDATRWVIDHGIADPARICIYGASYGGYAALMGVVKEQALYRCAVGYVGVYDLPVLHEDDSDEARSLGTWANDWLGDPAVLATRSPNRLAAQIKVPVFLAAGGLDETAPIKHSRMMEKALKEAGVPVETLYYPTEGHGFYSEPHQREFYTRLLDFLHRHIGGAKALPVAE